MITKALKNTLEQLLSLNMPLWIQVGGMTMSISLGVIMFSTYPSGGTTLEVTLLFLTELFIVLFSIATFSVYLSKIAAKRAEKLGMRKTLGASGWNLFLETSAQTTLLIVLSIFFSIAIVDVSLALTGVNFGALLQSLGVVHFGLLLLAVFIVSEGVLFIVQGVALAPNAKADFEATTLYEKIWLLKLSRALNKLSLVLGCMVLLAFVLLHFTEPIILRVSILYFAYFGLLASWWFINRKISTTIHL